MNYALTLAFAVLLLAACPTPRPLGPVSATLTAAPLSPLAGGDPHPLGQLGAGRPMVVDLYATWCTECRKQIAGLEALADEHGDRLVVVGVDVGEELDVATRFAEREGIGYPTYGDPDFEFADSMGISQLPALLVVDHDGAVVHRAKELDAATRAAIKSLVDR